MENLAHYARPLVLTVLALTAIAMAAGAVLVWPSHSGDRPLPTRFQSADGGPITTVDATVVSQTRADCATAGDGTLSAEFPQIPSTGGTCISSIARIDSGPDAGRYTVLAVPTNASLTDDDRPGGTGSTADLDPDEPVAGQPTLRVDQRIRLAEVVAPDGRQRYSFHDYRRGTGLLWWALAFVIAVIAVATWRGLRAVVGLAFAFGVLGYFTLPSILDGNSPVTVAVISSAAILFPVIFLAHGLNMRAASALLGTLLSLGLAAGLSHAAVSSLTLTGLSGESTRSLQVYQGSISLSGLLLAGFVIGTLGVLNDVTITQASTTFELAALPGQSRLSAFRGAMRVGRDHIASTVYTLVFAYAGSALPLLLLFSVAGQPISGLLTGEEVAIELARTFVGGIALALSVPITTAIATGLVSTPRDTPA
ncbi:MAG: YibE/F family protein [Gordonia sp. (in: high G+C Gram-positive bacteria)]